MNFQPQECTQCKADVIALRSPAPCLASLNANELLYPAMKVLYRPSLLCIFHSHKIAHLQIVSCPVFNASICGDCLEDFYQPILFEMHDLPAISYVDLADRSIACTIRVHLPVLLQARQPYPLERADQLEVIDAAVPAIEDHTARLEPSLPGLRKHLLEVTILGQSIISFVVDAIVARDVTITIAPQQGDEIDTADHILVLAGPMSAYKLDLAGIRLVQSRIIKNKDARFAIYLMAGFFPQIFAAWFKTLKQTSKRIVRSRITIFVWLDSCRFCAAINFRSRNQKINVVVLVTFWSIHSGVLHYFTPTA